MKPYRVSPQTILSAGALLIATAFLSAGCDSLFGGDETPTGSLGTGAVGEGCSSTADCRPGLRCEDDLCAAVGAQPEGARCVISDECAPGLYCSMLGQCAPSGDVNEGGACSTSGDCTDGLYCELAGFAGSCTVPGSGDAGSDCATTSDCLAGLACMDISGDGEPICSPGAAGGGLVLIQPVECEDSGVAEGDSFKVHFEVPRSGEASSEFYRLPFPNDIRLVGGDLDLAGHNRPELDTVGNIVKTLIEQLESDIKGFGPHQAVFFRFNEFPDPSSIRIDGDDPVLYLVNIDSDSEDFGRHHGLSWSATDGRGSFICNNWLALRAPWSQPLEHGTTYAAIITDAIRGRNGETPAQAADFSAVISGTEPADPELALAWQAYAPLRTFLTSEGIPAGTIMGAAVFTTDDPDGDFAGVVPALQAIATPSHGDLVRCDDGVTSPCDDGLTGADHVRGCFTEGDDYFELHTTIDLPLFQAGEPPFFEQDGGVLFDDSGVAIAQGSQSVCAAITVPRGTSMPAEGWPVVVYAHGTGGSFRSHVDGLGSDLSALGYATIGYDGVQHGTRRGDSDLPPDVLFFNVVNPRAARGNVLQGAVDVLALERFAREFSVEAGASPTTGAIRTNPNKVVFFGHSQGSTVGSLALAVEHGYAAAILSGAGGGLLLSLLAKTEPIDIAGGIDVVLQESGSEFHPVLNLIQMYFEGADPLNYASDILHNRPEGATTPSVFQTYGLGDSYTPDATIEVLATTMGISQLTPVIEDFRRPTVDPPVTGNLANGAATAALGQYEPPAGRDGHFVIFDNEAARAQMLGLLESLLTAEVPTIPVAP